VTFGFANPKKNSFRGNYDGGGAGGIFRVGGGNPGLRGQGAKPFF
jgi:hypothetical protein